MGIRQAFAVSEQPKSEIYLSTNSDFSSVKNDEKMVQKNTE